MSKSTVSGNAGVVHRRKSPVKKQAVKPIPGGATPTNKFPDGHGSVINKVRVQMIYWGTAWATNPTPSQADITAAVKKILAGPYMTDLIQYRGIDYGTFQGETSVTAVVGSGATQSPANPPNSFTDAQVFQLITNLVAAGTVPSPDAVPQILYCVVVPVGVQSSNSAAIGEHTYDTNSAYTNKFHFAWVENDGTLDYVTEIFSHELAESCTDPEGDAFTGVAGTCSGTGWCEIGDVCEGVTGLLNGISVQAYWSDQAGACVIPQIHRPNLSRLIDEPELTAQWYVKVWLLIHGPDPAPDLAVSATARLTATTRAIAALSRCLNNPQAERAIITALKPFSL